MKTCLPVLFLSFAALSPTVQKAEAAAADDIKLSVSTQICDGSNSSDKSFVVYATNTNPNRRISANFSYESAPAGQSFTLYDSTLTSFTDRFPKYHERRLAPGERAKVGCTINYSSSPNPLTVTAVPVVTTVAGAVYVDPSKPAPPPEKATDFVGFINELGFAGCPGGTRPAGLIFVENFHPFRTLSVSVDMTDLNGGAPGHFKITLAPLAISRIGCSNGRISPIRVAEAQLTGN